MVTNEERIAGTPVPFIGRVLDEVGSEDERIATYQVEESFRIELPDRVAVRLGGDSGPAQTGAVLAYASPGGDLWASFGPCYGPVPADLLRSYFQSLPQPVGEGTVQFLVATELGGTRIVALDGDGRALAYGFGSGTVRALAVCPEEQKVVEVVVTPTDEIHSTITLEIRDLSTLEVTEEPRTIRTLRTSSLWRDSPHLAGGLTCHSSDGSRASYLFPRTTSLGSAELHLWDGDDLRIVPADGAWAAAFDRQATTAYLVRISQGSDARVTAMDLTTGEERQLYHIPEVGYGPLIALSPDGAHLAIGVQGSPLVLLSTVDDQRFEIGITGGSMVALQWTRGMAALTKTSPATNGVATVMVHPDGWIGPLVTLPDSGAHIALVSNERVIQLGEESVAMSAIADPNPELVDMPPLYPTFGVVVPGSTHIAPEARLRNVATPLPADSFEPLDDETLRLIDVAISASSKRLEARSGPPATEGTDAPPTTPSQSSRTPWILLGSMIVVAATASLWVLRRKSSTSSNS